VNDRIRSIAVVGMVLLAALIIGTTYWQAWAESQLSAQQDNALQRVAQFKIDRGDIKTEDGTVLALNHVLHVKGNTFYLRHYPVGPLAVAVVGYSTQGRSRAGLERSMNDFLTASNSDLNTVLTRTLNSLEGKTVRGNSLVLTLKLGPQFLAQKALAGSCGAAVALDVKTGKVLVMATSPTYNPNLVEHHFDQIAGTKAPCYGAPSPLLNRATAGLYQPGSSFKLVTAAAALDSGTFTPDSTFFDPGYCVEFGKQVHNFQDQSGPEVFGNVTLAQGLQHSINSVFCNVGKHIGGLKILDYAKRFGFYSLPPLETPPDESAPSGLYKYNKHGRHLWTPTSNTQIDSGRLAFGQFNMLATPLQMALVGATIADKGVEPRPYLVKKIVAADGTTVTKTKPQPLGRVLKPQTAAELNQMMQLVVQGGTAATVGFPPSLKVAGKTGTAELGLGNIYDSWFVAFAPADNPRYVVAVVVEKQPNGFGASVAAPIAKIILEKLLHG